MKFVGLGERLLGLFLAFYVIFVLYCGRIVEMGCGGLEERLSGL